MIRRLFTILLLIMGFFLLSPAPANAKGMGTKHTIHASARPYKALGRGVKALGHKFANVAVSTAGFSFLAFDSAVIDPFGVALQAFADGVDMFVAQPLEALPKPLEYIGDGVHYVYLGIDKAGQVLAR